MGNNILCYFSRSTLGTYLWVEWFTRSQKRKREESYVHLFSHFILIC